MSPAAFGPDRWRRLEELFHASVDIPAEQRDAFLEQSCGPDQQLRVELESLLANDRQESPLIAGIVDETTASLLEEDEAADA